jgi:isopenicillin-N epimerase
MGVDIGVESDRRASGEFEGDTDWDADQIRGLWTLDPQVHYLNHGSFGAVPREVGELQDRLRAESERNPMAWFRQLPERIVAARTALAPFCGAPAEGTALVANVSAAITTVLASFPLRPDQEIVYTDHAYGAVRLAIERAAGEGARPVHLPLEAGPQEVLDRVVGAVDERTALVVIDQITSATAACLPVAEIVAACHERGVPVLVDGAHAPGMLPVPAAGMDADFWTGNLHKWPCAPRGTGALVVAPQWRDRIRPLVASWSEHAQFPLPFDQAGTLDQTGWLAAPTALEVLGRLGWDRVRRHNERLATYGQQVFCEALKVDLPPIARPAPSMRLVPLPGSVTDARALHERLFRECRIEVPVTSFGDRLFLRISAHAYNRPADYQDAARATAALLD